MIHATRIHDISCGHTVTGQEIDGKPGPCSRLHGHNYRFHLTISPELNQDQALDSVGRVIDFGEIKRKLCSWLDTNWDHKFLIWTEDKRIDALTKIDPTVVWTNFNPTAENLAIHLIEVIGPEIFKGTGVVLSSCIVEETMKCSAECERGIYH